MSKEFFVWNNGMDDSDLLQRKLAAMFVKQVSGTARFAPDKMSKTTVAQGDFLFAGLNCFEPDQEHAAHAHEGQDKLYFILEGSGLVQVGEKVELLRLVMQHLLPPELYIRFGIPDRKGSS